MTTNVTSNTLQVRFLVHDAMYEEGTFTNGLHPVTLEEVIDICNNCIHISKETCDILIALKGYRAAMEALLDKLEKEVVKNDQWKILIQAFDGIDVLGDVEEEEVDNYA